MINDNKRLRTTGPGTLAGVTVAFIPTSLPSTVPADVLLLLLLMCCWGLMQTTGRAPTPQEIALHLEQPLTRVLLCMRKAQRPINLDAQSGDSERDSMVDQLAASIDEDGGDSGLGSLQHR